MTLRITILLLALFFLTHAIGQTRTLRGKVIDKEFRPLYGVKIFNADTTLLTTSDADGNFGMTVPRNSKSLIVASVGMEWKSLDLSDSCSNLDIILLPSATYDFMTAGKVDRLRKKDFDKLPVLHKAAFKRGLFESDTPCYADKFISIKKLLKEIHKRRTQQPST